MNVSEKTTKLNIERSSLIRWWLRNKSSKRSLAIASITWELKTKNFSWASNKICKILNFKKQWWKHKLVARMMIKNYKSQNILIDKWQFKSISFWLRRKNNSWWRRWERSRWEAEVKVTTLPSKWWLASVKYLMPLQRNMA